MEKMNQLDAEMFMPRSGMLRVHGLIDEAHGPHKPAVGPIMPELDMIKLAQDLSHVVSQKMAKKTTLTTTQKRIRRILRDFKRVHQKMSARSASSNVIMDEIQEDQDLNDMNPDEEDIQDMAEEPEAATFMEATETEMEETKADEMEDEYNDAEKDDESVASNDEDEDEAEEGDDQTATIERMSGPLTFKPCLRTLTKTSSIADATRVLQDHLKKHGYEF